MIICKEPDQYAKIKMWLVLKAESKVEVEKDGREGEYGGEKEGGGVEDRRSGGRKYREQGYEVQRCRSSNDAGKRERGSGGKMQTNSRYWCGSDGSGTTVIMALPKSSLCEGEEEEESERKKGAKGV